MQQLERVEGHSMEARFAGRLALVAGGTGALGRAVSLAFLQEGAHVVVTYQYQDELDALRSAAGARASALEGHSIDLTDESAVRRLLDGLLARHGPLHALVNAAGGYTGGEAVGA
jgi:NAD(P)-dependent dehydrogenase (short-subunit alcohol dehydrogenase family)